mmetsp:Transcript_9236/g.19998  ORF Transcript_9236/g.19998 Transcript_9236/m.19998 type:complete len:222 (-) Transcript_9236:442-1107(-)
MHLEGGLRCRFCSPEPRGEAGIDGGAVHERNLQQHPHQLVSPRIPCNRVVLHQSTADLHGMILGQRGGRAPSFRELCSQASQVRHQPLDTAPGPAMSKDDGRLSWIVPRKHRGDFLQIDSLLLAQDVLPLPRHPLHIQPDRPQQGIPKSPLALGRRVHHVLRRAHGPSLNGKPMKPQNGQRGRGLHLARRLCQINNEIVVRARTAVHQGPHSRPLMDVSMG